MVDEQPRTRKARVAAERALIRVVHHYGTRPEFVLIGGLVPELLCSHSRFLHSGTTPVDVQVNLEIAAGSINAHRLEQALRNAEFEPDAKRVWRWKADGDEHLSVVKFELLADLDDQPSQQIVSFDECEALGAVNLRGTGYATEDVEIRTLRANVAGMEQSATINVTGLAGFLMAKCAAAYGRRKPNDWYDIAYVLIHNDAGGVEAAGTAVRHRFINDLESMRTQFDDLRDNFVDPDAQGPLAYAGEMAFNHEDLYERGLAAEAVTAVTEFHQQLYR